MLLPPHPNSSWPSSRLREPRRVRATVGSLTVAPGAMNVVPGEVGLSLNVRHATDAVRRQLVEQLLLRARG